MQNLRVSLIQSNILWEKIDKNLAHFSQKINQVKGQTDLVILPEMFSTGFSMKPKRVAEPMDGKNSSMDETASKRGKCGCDG